MCAVVGWGLWLGRTCFGVCDILCNFCVRGFFCVFFCVCEICEIDLCAFMDDMLMKYMCACADIMC